VRIAYVFKKVFNDEQLENAPAAGLGRNGGAPPPRAEPGTLCFLTVRC